MNKSLLYKDPVEPAHWVGLMKSNDLLDYLRVTTPHIPPLDFSLIIDKCVHSACTGWLTGGTTGAKTPLSLGRTIC